MAALLRLPDGEMKTAPPFDDAAPADYAKTVMPAAPPQPPPLPGRAAACPRRAGAAVSAAGTVHGRPSAAADTLVGDAADAGRPDPGPAPIAATARRPQRDATGGDARCARSKATGGHADRSAAERPGHRGTRRIPGNDAGAHSCRNHARSRHDLGRRAGIAAARCPTARRSALLAGLLRRGDALLALGDVSGAQRFYKRAAEPGSATGARAVGRTHDPAVLAALGVRGIRPDAAAASAWYPGPTPSPSRNRP